MRILFTSDPHLPYTRLDLWKKLFEFNKTYRADLVLCSGDFFDFYALSKYIKNPRGDTSYSEILKCIPQVKQIKKWFPRIEILPGNHDDRIKKRAMEAGISDLFLKDALDVVGAPKGWAWTSGDRVEYDKIVFTHGWFGQAKKHAEFFNQSCAHGHLHASPGVQFIGREEKVVFNACVGFMADKNTLALQYGPIKYSTGVCAFGTFTKGVPHVQAF